MSFESGAKENSSGAEQVVSPPKIKVRLSREVRWAVIAAYILLALMVIVVGVLIVLHG